jgi:LuxR family maltose regulon positive regulatory protein
MYHSEVGRLDAELADMESYTPFYVDLTKGHGSGSAALMQAEALLCRGETGEAEILGHKAWYQAELRGQSSICIASLLLSGRLAILNGNAGEFSSLLERMARQVENNPQKSDRLEADMARSFLMELLGRPEEVAEWLQRGDIHKERLFAMCIPYAHMLYAKYLLLTGKPEIWLGLADEALDLAGALHYPLALIYGHIHSAAAREMRQERSLALASLRRALDLALPDRLHLPFAENHSFIAPLLEELRPELPPDSEASIVALSGRQEAGSRNIMAGLYAPQGLFGLSPRELEVARLAAEGLTTGEVAQQLHISLNTVKTHLKTAYRKTGISSRRALKKMLLM